jgi:hypothetical protein
MILKFLLKIENNKIYKDSNIYDYLNSDFLNTLTNHNCLVKNIENNYVSLLTSKDYNMTYKSILPSMGYLIKDKDWLILDEEIMLVDTKGDTKELLLGKSKGIRPVINLNGNLVVTGSGTEKDPYSLT